MKYHSTKTYGHAVGFTCAFRQWRADSHCKYLHGYALEIHFDFGSDELDVRNWVVDFGSLKPLKAMLENTLDHTTLVAHDDPHLEWFKEAHRLGIANVVEIEHAGCERLAELIYNVAEQWLVDAGYSPRVKLFKVEVREHGANSGYYSPFHPLDTHLLH